MSMNRNIFSRPVLLAVVIDLYLLLTVSKISGILNHVDELRTGLFVFIGVLAVIGMIFLLNRTVDPVFFFILLNAVLYFLLLFYHSQMAANNLLLYFYFPLIFLACYVTFLLIKTKEEYRRILALQILTFVLLFLIHSYGRFYYEYAHGSIINSVYYQVSLLPFLLLIQKGWLRNLLLVMLLFNVFYSMKRTAFFAVLLALLFYFSVALDSVRARKSLREERRHPASHVGQMHSITCSRVKKYNMTKPVRLAVIGAGLVALFFLLNLLVNALYGFDLFARLGDLWYDGGSGRMALWADTMNGLQDSSLMEWVFGHGLQSTGEITDMNAAHNDFLEILYRCGLIGLFSYGLIMARMLRFAATLKKEKNSLYGPFGASLLIFLVISMFSQLVYQRGYIAFFILFWCYCLSRYTFDKRLKAGDNETCREQIG